MKYIIVAKHVSNKDKEWELIDETNDLGQALRWKEDYELYMRAGWNVRIKKLARKDLYEFLDFNN